MSEARLDALIEQFIYGSRIDLTPEQLEQIFAAYDSLPEAKQLEITYRLKLDIAQLEAETKKADEEAVLELVSIQELNSMNNAYKRREKTGELLGFIYEAQQAERSQIATMLQTSANALQVASSSMNAQVSFLNTQAKLEISKCNKALSEWIQLVEQSLSFSKLDDDLHQQVCDFFHRYKVVLQERKERLFSRLIEPNHLQEHLQQEQDSAAQCTEGVSSPHQDDAEPQLPFVKIQTLVQEIMSILPQGENLSYLKELLQEANKQQTASSPAKDAASKSHAQSPASAKGSRSTMRESSSHKRHRQATPIQKSSTKHSSSTFALPKQPIQQKSTVPKQPLATSSKSVQAPSKQQKSSENLFDDEGFSFDTQKNIAHKTSSTASKLGRSHSKQGSSDNLFDDESFSFDMQKSMLPTKSSSALTTKSTRSSPSKQQKSVDNLSDDESFDFDTQATAASNDELDLIFSSLPKNSNMDISANYDQQSPDFDMDDHDLEDGGEFDESQLPDEDFEGGFDDF